MDLIFHFNRSKISNSKEKNEFVMFRKRIVNILHEVVEQPKIE